MGDKTQSNTNETTDDMTFTVTNFDKGVYDVDVHFISKNKQDQFRDRHLALIQTELSLKMKI